MTCFYFEFTPSSIQQIITINFVQKNMHRQTNASELRQWNIQESKMTTSEEEISGSTSQDYLERFQKNNEVFMLRSELNEANLALQKMAIQQQESAIEERQFYQKIEQEKIRIEERQAELEEQVKKNVIIAEAERNTKISYSKQLKMVKEELQLIKNVLHIQEESSSEAVLKEITCMKEQIEKLENQLISTKKEMDSRTEKNSKDLTKLQEQNTRKIHIISSSLETEVKKYKEQLQILKSQQSGKDKLIEELSSKLQHLGEAQIKVNELTLCLQEQRKFKLSQEQTIYSLKIKEELLSITKEKWQEEKARFNQHTEEIKFKLELTSKKYQTAERNLKNEIEKSRKQEEIINSLKDKLTKSQNKQVELEESVSQLRQKVKIGQIYKDKFKNAQTSLQKQGSSIEDYEKTIADLEIQVRAFSQQLNFFQGQKVRYQQTISDLSREIQQKDKEITKLTISSAHQGQLIKDCRSQISKFKLQLDQTLKEANRKKSIISVTNQSQSEGGSQLQRQQWQRISEDIINHYQGILEIEDKNRKLLQGQIQKADEMCMQLRRQLGQRQKELTETEQENRLIKQQNERLLKTIATLQTSHQKKMQDWKERLRQLHQSKSPTFDLTKEKKMRITTCFNVSQKNSRVEKKTDQIDEMRERIQMKEQIQKEDCRFQYHGFANLVSTDNLLSVTKSSLSPKSIQLDRVISNYRQTNKNIKHKLNL